VRHEARRQSPFATDLFFLYRSTGSKQTPNGLFLCNPYPLKGYKESFNCQSSFLPKDSGLRDNYILLFIRTTQPKYSL
ncbi:MAG TPA: hypothetical protein VFU29_03795, partial [Chitinophagaceae bacterium]|nr:hypothetical protein [Chitinophagaceae bacterium]